MANKLYEETSIQAIADAIREKNGTSDTYAVSQMADAVRAIQTGVEPVEYSYNQIPILVKNYLDNVTYDSSDYTVSNIADYAPSTADVNNTYPVGITLETSEGVLDREGFEVSIIDGNTTVYNDIPNKYTEYVVRNNGIISQAGTIKPTGFLRQIKCATTNVRDLGGWACDGGTVKYGKLFRGGEFQEADLDIFLNQLGIRHELNLRGTNEAQGNVTILRDYVDFTCPESYAWYTIADSYKQTWKKILRCAFDCVAQNKPLFFHCAAGADRTGTVACILSAILGVSQSDLDKDYELTSFSTGSDTDTNARRRNESEWSGLISQITALSVGTTFRDKVLNWVASLGFTVDEINDYRTSMIDGTPDIITLDIDLYSVTNTLTNITSNNDETTAIQYQPYEAEISVPEGYVIESVIVTMGGVNITSSVFNGTKTNLRRAITKNATNCSINGKKAVIDGQDFVAVITANSGYTLDGGMITITMGGIDMTEYYSDGKIAIPNVTGDIIITATAVPTATNYTNQVAISLDTDGSIFNEKGYIENGRLNSSGIVVQDNLEGYNYIATGFIPFNWGDVIRFENAYILNYNNVGMRTITYDSDFNLLVSPLSMSPEQLANNNVSSQMEIEQGDVGMTYQGIKKIILPSSPTYGSDACYVRFTLERPSTDVVPIVTLNEEID